MVTGKEKRGDSGRKNSLGKNREEEKHRVYKKK